MKWYFDGKCFVTEYSIRNSLEIAVDGVVELLTESLFAVTEAGIRPSEMYLTMHLKAAETIKSERAKRLFLASAHRRAKKMGKSVLMRVSHEMYDFRLIITQVSVSVLRECSVKKNSSMEVAKVVKSTIGGDLHEIVF